MAHFEGGSGVWTSTPFAIGDPSTTPAPDSPGATPAPATATADLRGRRGGTLDLDPETVDLLRATGMVLSDLGQPRSAQSTRGRSDDASLGQLLLRHLNANRMYYSRCVWLAQDPDERILTLQSNPWLKGTGILNSIDFTPVGVSGSHVAFPFHGEMPWPEPVSLKQSAGQSRLISLPSRGVFAEVHLSHCPAREQRDPSRMYGPGEVPAPTAPQISGIQPGSRQSDLDLSPTTTPNPIVNIQNAPSAPDPLGLTAALAGVTAGDAFRDMSTSAQVSSLLDGLVSGSLSHSQAREVAARAKSALERSVGAAERGVHPALNGDATRMYDHRQVIESSGLSPTEKHDAIRNVVDPGPTSFASLGAQARSPGRELASGTTAIEKMADLLPRAPRSFTAYRNNTPWITWEPGTLYLDRYFLVDAFDSGVIYLDRSCTLLYSDHGAFKRLIEA